MSAMEQFTSLTYNQLCKVAHFYRLHGYSYFKGEAEMINFMYDNKIEIPNYVLKEKPRRRGRPLAKPKSSYFVDENGDLKEVSCAGDPYMVNQDLIAFKSWLIN